jgi:hypothetical protein
MSTHFPTIYKKSTGEIVQTGMFTCDDEFVDANFAVKLQFFGSEDHGIVDASAAVDTQYVAVMDEVAIVAGRSPLIVEVDKTTLVADGIDSITLTGLPDPCDIIIDAPDPLVETSVQTVTGGGFVFVADDPGVYTVEVRRWPFLPFKIEFTAT